MPDPGEHFDAMSGVASARRRGCLPMKAVAATVAFVAVLITAGGPAFAGPPVRSLLEMRHDRIVIQQWDMSCGAAALATVLHHQMGLPITEREVALQLVSREEYLENPDVLRLRNGFSLLDMKRVSEQLGYKGAGFGKMTLDDLVKMAPVIVPIDVHGYYHFVIFRGIAAGRVLLGDPAWGNRTMPVDEFVEAWLDYGEEKGRVGFIITNPDGSHPPNRLAPTPDEFLVLR